MGTSATPAQMAGKIEKLAKEMGNPMPALTVVAKESKRTFEASAGGVIGRRVGGKRRRITAGYRFMGRGQHASVEIGYRGPAHLVNNPTRAHEILPRRARGRARGRGKRALVINGSPVASAQHPGTAGKHFFEKAKAIVEVQAPRTFAKHEMTEPLRRTFG